MSTSIVWFRRDLRLADHPALTSAAADGPVVGVFVIDPTLWDRAGAARRAWVGASVRTLQAATDGALVVMIGDAAKVLPEVADAVGARVVHVTGETTPYGRGRDARVAAALAQQGVRVEPDGTPYAVDPGMVRTQQGGAYQVFTPFARAWREHNWPDPLPAPGVEWRRMRSDAGATARLEATLREAPAGMPAAGEDAAHRRFQAFLEGDLDDYDEARDLPGADRTSRMSAYLKVGAVHPRQLLARLPQGADRFVTELAWREFYADVLWHHPTSAWTDLRPLAIPYDDPGDALDAWRDGLTGYPIVDAGMRQLLSEGWMHNRVRMITASFLTKDLHAWWPVGAKHFLDHLIDGDLASNSHGWQWVAGTGTDASPYFRVFNPVTQGRKFDPDGDYVRRWVPELGHLAGAGAHEPWRHDDGYDHAYPHRIVDHDDERRDALARYAAR
ncbi:MAG: deoxyribodipyrimidine photo-lyase [Nocardioides sp.]